MKGVSYFFITVDILGAVFSLLSLAFKAKFDVVAGLTYTTVAVSVIRLFLTRSTVLT